MYLEGLYERVQEQHPHFHLVQENIWEQIRAASDGTERLPYRYHPMQ